MLWFCLIQYMLFLMYRFAVSYSDIAFDVIYFNLSPPDYTEPHFETWIWSGPFLLLPSGLVKNHFSDEQRLDVRAHLSVMLMCSVSSTVLTYLCLN